MAIADDRVIASFWDTGSLTWVDFRLTTFNSSSNAYVYSNSAASSVQSCNIVDKLYTPKKATLQILNRPEQPFSDNAATGGTQGPWTGRVGQFTRLKIMDGLSKQIYFVGFIFDIQDQFNVLTIKAYDDLNELRDLSTAGKPDFKIEPGRSEVTRFTSLPLGSAVDSATNQFTDYLGSRSGIIKSIINLYANNITATNASAADTRFEDSASEYQFTPWQSAYVTITNINVTGGINASVDNFVVDDSTNLDKVGLIIQVDNERMKIKSVNTGSHTLTVERGADNTDAASHNDDTAIKAVNGSAEIYKMTQGDSPTSLLTNIQHLAVEDPHKGPLSVNSGTGGQTYGYDYYSESNIVSPTLTTLPVPSFLHYFKKGERPTGSPTSDSDGYFNQGLNIQVPNPTSTANGEFSETGRLIPCTEYDISRPQDEVYTEAAVSYNDLVTQVKNKSNNFIKEPKTTTFQLIQVGDVTNPNDVPGVFAPLGSEVTRYGGGGDRNGYFNGQVTDKSSAGKVSNGASGGIIGTGREPAIDGDSTDNGGKSPEWLKVRLTNLASSIDHNDTTLTVATTAGMYVGQKLQLGVTGTLGTAMAASTSAVTVDFNPSYSGTWNWGTQSVFAANDKILVHGTFGTEEMTIASLDTSAGTLTVTTRNATTATTNAAVAHESGASVEAFPEIVTVTAVNSATEIEVTRYSEDSRSVNKNWDGNTNTEIYAWKVARPQWLSLAEVGNVNGGGIPAQTETCDMLISHVDPNIAKGTSSTTYANKFDTYWKTNAYSSGSWSGNSLRWIGQDSLSSFALTYSPQETYEYRRSLNVNFNDIGSPDVIRQRIGAILQRKTHQVLRTTLNTYRPPRYYFDDVVQSVNASGTTQTIDLSSSTNPNTEGLFIGCVANVLSSGVPTGVYGYISALSATTATVTWNTGSGVSGGDTVRYYVPVRAGDIIKHRNDPENINQFMRVTEVTYDENNGVALTRYKVVGAQSSKEGADARMEFSPPFYEGSGEESFLMTDVPFEKKDNMLTFAFVSADSDTITWPGGDLYIGDRRYVIDSGTTGNMTVGDTNIIYYQPGQNAFLVADQDTYLRYKRSTYGQNLVKIATVFAVAAASGKAYVRLAPGFSSPDVGDISNAPDIINSNSLTATLQKKGNQGWATDIIFEGTDWDDIKWHKVGSSDSTNANVSFSDGTNEAITYGTKTFSGSELNKTIYAYKAVGDSASGTIVFTTDYTALYQDDRILLATFVTAASDDGTDSPSIFPFNGSQPTISAGLISAGAIVAEQIKSGTITTTQLNFTPETNSSDKTAGTVGGWKLNSSNIYSGSSPVTSGYSSAADITLTSSGTIHAKQFYIDSSGNANFKGDISGASGTFTGSLTGATGSFGDCQLTSDGFVAVGSTLGFGVKSGSSWYGAIGYTGGSMILSTTTTDKSTITPRMYFEDDAGTYGAHIYIPPATTTTEIAQHRMQRYTSGGSQFSTMFVSGDRDGTDGDPYGYIGVNASNAQAPYTRVYSYYHGAGDGSASAPGFHFSSDPDTGMYLSATGDLAFTAAGTQRLKVNNFGITAGLSSSSGTSGMQAVYIDVTTATNRFYRITSSKRYKENIRNLEIDTSNIYDLRPVNYTSKDTKVENFGLIAEEVDEYFPEIVTHNKEGQADSVDYQMLSVLLLSEMKKLKDEIKELKEDK